MDTVAYALQSAVILVVGLAARLLLLLLGIALITALALPVAFAMEGIRKLWTRVALERIAGLRWRAHAYYTPAHQWLRERFGRLRIGLDDVAAHVVGAADVLTLPVAGTHVKPGDPLLTLGRGLSSLVVRAPIDGVVTRVNPYLVNHPAAITTDPYRRGWLVELSPADTRHREFLHDEPAREWFADEAARLSGALGAAAPANKNGVAQYPPAVALADAQRQLLAREFLQA